MKKNRIATKMPVLHSWDRSARYGLACMNTVYRKKMPMTMAVRYFVMMEFRVDAFVFINDSSLSVCTVVATGQYLHSCVSSIL